ncbi:MAG: alpha/beta hydrolase [Ilumatobacteraceae bacterium]|nr:alpha/beta hydrolase [Ilumatobacteraceae bacterium]
MTEFDYRLDVNRRADHLLVLLHGYGATQHDIAPVAQHVDPIGRFSALSPRGPIEVAGGGASWYDFDASWTADPASFAAVLEALDAFVGSVASRLSIERKNVVVGGFSQGAGLAAWLAYDTPQESRPAGLWCCGTIIDVDNQALDLTAAQGSRALILAGRSDPNVPLERSRAQASRLEEASVDVTMSEHDGGHGLSAPMLADMTNWLTTIP